MHSVLVSIFAVFTFSARLGGTDIPLAGMIRNQDYIRYLVRAAGGISLRTDAHIVTIGIGCLHILRFRTRDWCGFRVNCGRESMWFRSAQHL